MSKLKSVLPILLILIFGFAVRVVGLNWDQDYHLHPDERFLTMVAVAIEWPGSLAEYFSTQSSPLNPHNKNFDFYVYGLWPIVLVKAASQLTLLHDYTNLNLVGRVMSALIDALVILFVYKITLRLTKKKPAALVSAFIYSSLVLPIQLSHFFATDSYLNLLLTVCLYCLVLFLEEENPKLSPILIGITFGLAISTKISAVLFAPIIALAFLIHLIRHRKFFHLVIAGLVMLVTAFVCVRIFYPYLFDGSFTPNPKLISNWQQLKALETPSPYFPPSVQWANTPRWLFQFLNIFFFGLGPVWGILVLLSLFKTRWFKSPGLFLLVGWILLLFGFQGSQIVKPMRYLLPIFPALAVLCALYLANFPKKFQASILILGALFAMAFTSIYQRPHTRVAASEWIYKNIPAGAKLSCDLWDDCLPLSSGSYVHLQMHPFDPAWPQYETALKDVEYLVITSNRTYGSIAHTPHFYPQTSQFYHDLFSGRTEFKKIAEFTSRPGFSIPGVSLCITPPGLDYGAVSGSDCTEEGIWLVDDFSDETFTVYDHPKVTIFQKASLPVPKI